MRSLVLATLSLLAACAPFSDGSNTDDLTPANCAAWEAPQLAGHLEALELTEASGLAASRRHPGVLYAHNDSGGRAVIFGLREDGRTTGEWTIDGAVNVDWEDMAVAACEPGADEWCLYVADVGDNLKRRETVTIYVADEPADPSVGGSLQLRRRIDFSYDSGPVDVEALLVHPTTAEVLLVAKWSSGAADSYDVFALTAGEGGAAGLAARVGAVEQSEGPITGGAVRPQGDRVLLRTYASVLEWRVPEGRALADFPAGELSVMPPIVAAVGAGEDELQGEAVTYDAAGRAVLTTSEGAGAPLNRRRCIP